VTNSENPLAELKGLHLPESVSSLPLAPGWWVLLIFILLVSFWLIKAGLARVRKNAYRRTALVQLKEIYRQQKILKNDRLLLHGINKLLKTIAIAQYPEKQCNPLYGNDWALFLRQAVKPSTSLDYECFLLLAKSYEGQVSINAQQLSALYHATQLWIRQHQVPLKNNHFAAEYDELATATDISTRENKLV